MDEDLLKMKLREAVEDINRCHALINSIKAIDIPRLSKDQCMLSLSQRVEVMKDLIDLYNEEANFLTKTIRKIREMLKND